MHSGQGVAIKKAFLYAMIGSVGFSAFLGIGVILSGRFGWLETRILLTTITIAVASICGLACGASLASHRGQVFPLAGVALSVLATAMIIAGIWIEVPSQAYWKLTASASVFSVACAHLALLSLARLAEWFRWSLVVAHVAILGVASLIVLAIFVELHSAGMFQLLAVTAIVDAAFTILIPIFHRLSKVEVPGRNGIPTSSMPWEMD